MPKILVADDSIAVRKVAERLLTEAGLGVTLAANGEEALAYLAKEKPDVIVSDVIMPDKSGYEVCAFVRNHAMLSTTPVLLISGIVNDEVTKQAESCHADGVLKKPFQGTSLKDRVLELLAKRQDPSPAAPAPRPAPAAAPAPASVPAPATAPASAAAAPAGSRVSEEQLDTYRQAAGRVKELEMQLSVERAKMQELAQRAAELDAVKARQAELNGQLEQERRRAEELAQQVSHQEERLAAIAELERALKEEQELSAKLKRDSDGLQQALKKLAELDATLSAERAAAAQLVQQLTELEAAAARASELETRLVREEHRVADLERRAGEAEGALETERARVEELSAKLAEAERQSRHASELETKLAAEQQQAAEAIQRLEQQLAAERHKASESVRQSEELDAKLREVQALLTSEQDRSAALTRRASEAEQAAEQATKRFEDMARKLGEIAGLASQLGHGKGRS